MRILILAAAGAAIALPAAANAQYRGNGDYRVRQEQRECQRELRNADSRREYARELRECRREISQARRESWHDNRYDRYSRYDRDDRGRYWDGYRWQGRRY
jgi:hypothetical protein